MPQPQRNLRVLALSNGRRRPSLLHLQRHPLLKSMGKFKLDIQLLLLSLLQLLLLLPATAPFSFPLLRSVLLKGLPLLQQQHLLQMVPRQRNPLAKREVVHVNL